MRWEDCNALKVQIMAKPIHEQKLNSCNRKVAIHFYYPSVFLLCKNPALFRQGGLFVGEFLLLPHIPRLVKARVKGVEVLAVQPVGC